MAKTSERLNAIHNYMKNEGRAYQCPIYTHPPLDMLNKYGQAIKKGQRARGVAGLYTR